MNTKIRAAGALCAAIAVLWAPVASAQDPSTDYSPTIVPKIDEPGDNGTPNDGTPARSAGGPTATGGDDGNGDPARQVKEDDLPFTGLDLGIAALLGAALAGTGLVVRRAVRPNETS